MKKIMIVLACIVVLSAGLMTSLAKEKVIDSNQLPQKAQTFLKQYFPKSNVVLVKQDRELISQDYDVTFSDGTTIEFDADGQWTGIESLNEVPGSLIPAQIKTFLNQNNYLQGGVKIKKIGRDSRGYDVELTNGLEFEFDTLFKLVDMDN